MDINKHIQTTLFETIKILFPVDVDPNSLIKTHTWRNRKYVGEFHGKVVSWRGFSANLNSIDFRYRAIFVDVVENLLPDDERRQLFGEDFATSISDLSEFVVMFVLDFPLTAADEIKTQGFVPRRMRTVLHACCIATPLEFVSQSPLYWAAKIARLVLLQRVLSIHRKPLEANEVPLQNLLYRVGYLHSYLVKGGLELYELSRPRRAGNFGHDLHAIVRNPNAKSSAFSLGVEVYMGPIGYHAQTIPQYVNEFDLQGVIVIAKDNPFPALQSVISDFNFPIYYASKPIEIGISSGVAIHHLPLDKIVVDLATIRDELESILPTASFVK